MRFFATSEAEAYKGFGQLISSPVPLMASFYSKEAFDRTVKTAQNVITSLTNKYFAILMPALTLGTLTAIISPVVAQVSESLGDPMGWDFYTLVAGAGTIAVGLVGAWGYLTFGKNGALQTKKRELEAHKANHPDKESNEKFFKSLLEAQKLTAITSDAQQTVSQRLAALPVGEVVKLGRGWRDEAGIPVCVGIVVATRHTEDLFSVAIAEETPLSSQQLAGA